MWSICEMRLRMLVLAFSVVLFSGQLGWAVEWEGTRVVISHQEIRRLDVHSIQQLLNLVPGVQAFGRHLSIRGNYDVEVFMDGLSLRDPLGGGIRLELVPFELVEKVVVYKGGGVEGWAEGGSGGVVLIFTRQAQALRATAEAWVGAREYLDGRFCVGGRRGRWAVGLTGQYMHDGGYRRNNDRHKLRGGLRLRWSPKGWQGPGLPTFVLNGCELRRGLAGYPAYPTPRARAEDRSVAACLRWANWGISSTTSLKRIIAIRTNPDSSLDTKLECSAATQRVSSQLGPWQWTSSFSYRQAQGTDMAEHEEWELGVVLAREWEAGAVRARGGIRAQMHSHFSPWVGPGVRIELRSGAWEASATVRLGRNLPSFRQRYLHSSTLLPNPSLGPQQTLAISLGLRCQVRKRGSLGIEGFLTQVHERITYVRTGAVGQYRNGGLARIEGLELGGRWGIGQGVGLRASYIYLEAKDLDSGLWLAGKPRHRFILELSLGPVRGGSLIVRCSYRSQVFTRSDNRTVAGPRTVVGLRVQWVMGRVKLFARVDNLLDEQYLYGDGLPAPPLTWSVGLRWSL